ncbi:MAG TPA: hypothetical protein DCZ91_06635, partial [Lachnospiraceae bacterium]|nr:hypothetical protein [Lachnospiraceae bacterium]
MPMGKKYGFYGTALFFILLSLLATAKICFVYLDIDEEYAVTLSWRILSEDRMFLDIWEPHQTSGFLTAFLCWIYQRIAGTTDYLVLYLRICGALIQAAVSIFLYRTLAPHFSRFGALVAAFFFYNTLPKQIQTPEFSNMLVWFSVLAMLCFFRACHSQRSSLWLIAAGVCVCGLILSYPSCILVVPVYFLCLKRLRPQSFRRDSLTLLAVCAVLGIGYILFFLSHMTVSQFLFGLRQMMTDSAHSDSLLQRLSWYGRELYSFLQPMGFILYSAVFFFLVYGLAALKCKYGSFFRHLSVCCILCGSFVIQILLWSVAGYRRFHFPLLHFYLLYGAGILTYRKGCRAVGTKKRSIFWFGCVCGGCVWFAALLVTNTTLSVTGPYLMSGLIPAIVLLAEEAEEYALSQPKGSFRYRLPALLTAIGLLGTTLFAKGFLVCENEGRCSDIFLVRQKALSGPARNIYCSYMEGYAYNSYAELLEGCCTPGDSILYVGQHSLYYLLTDSRIGVHSTISTPTFDSRLLEYWSLFPEHYPALVVIDRNYRIPDEIDFVRNALQLREPVAENDEFSVYRVGEP